jgi:hypothetical protein
MNNSNVLKGFLVMILSLTLGYTAKPIGPNNKRPVRTR